MLRRLQNVKINNFLNAQICQVKLLDKKVLLGYNNRVNGKNTVYATVGFVR